MYSSQTVFVCFFNCAIILAYWSKCRTFSSLLLIVCIMFSSSHRCFFNVWSEWKLTSKRMKQRQKLQISYFQSQFSSSKISSSLLKMIFLFQCVCKPLLVTLFISFEVEKAIVFLLFVLFFDFWIWFYL